jgi:hypothetical protein
MRWDAITPNDGAQLIYLHVRYHLSASRLQAASGPFWRACDRGETSSFP